MQYDEGWHSCHLVLCLCHICYQSIVPSILCCDPIKVNNTLGFPRQPTIVYFQQVGYKRGGQGVQRPLFETTKQVRFNKCFLHNAQSRFAIVALGAFLGLRPYCGTLDGVLVSPLVPQLTQEENEGP